MQDRDTYPGGSGYDDATYPYDTPNMTKASGYPGEDEPVEESLDGGLSVSQQYAAILRDGATQLVAARDKLTQLQVRMEPGLTELYKSRAYLHLRPNNLRFMVAADETYLGYIGAETAAGLTTPEQQVTRLMDDAAIPRAVIGWREMPIALAAASMRRDEAADGGRSYQAMLGNTKVREIATQQLISSLGLYGVRSVTEMRPSELRHYNITPQDIVACIELAKIVPPRGVTDLPRMEAPPLHITHLAADVINFSADSVIPTGVAALRLRAKGWKQPVGHKSMVDQVSGAVGAYLQERYGYNQAPNGKVLSALAECDLAERQGFLNGDDAQQLRTANRARPIFGKLKESDRLPDIAQIIVDRSRELTRPAQS